MTTPQPEQAIHFEVFPCNPRPFARRIDELCSQFGSDAIKRPEARACLLILVQQSYGQLAKLDAWVEYQTLSPLIRNID